MESFESSAAGGSRLVVTELSHIKHLVTQLVVHLAESPELCKRLASQIFSLTERSIAVITSPDFDGGRKRSAADAGGLASSVAPKTAKKRKLDKMKNQVKVRMAGGSETLVDDGHSWRKYGQKEILGAKYPRSYYRCTHRHSLGCAATKQVQRTDEDPAIFDVFYLGEHTCCVQNTTATPTQHNSVDAQHGPLLQSQQLAVKTEGLASAEEQEPQGCWSHAAAAAAATAPPLCTSSTTPASVCLPPERSPFSSMSPATTSDSTHVAASLLAPPPFDPAAEWRAHSEFQEVVSALVVASAPPPPPVPIVDVATDELLDFDIASFLV